MIVAEHFGNTRNKDLVFFCLLVAISIGFLFKTENNQQLILAITCIQKLDM